MPNDNQDDSMISLDVSGVRQYVFEKMRSSLVDVEFPRIQRRIGVWSHVGRIPAVKAGDVTIMADHGCMTARWMIHDDPIMLSVFLFHGELRIGFRTPYSYYKALQNVHSGESRQASFEGSFADGERWVFSDWIFDEGFASADMMVKASHDHCALTWFADACTQQLTHLFMSLLSVSEEVRRAKSSADLAMERSGLVEEIVCSSDDSLESDGHVIEALFEVGLGSLPWSDIREILESKGVTLVSGMKQSDGVYHVLTESSGSLGSLEEKLREAHFDYVKVLSSSEHD